ncbi:hypothetical protein ABZ234_04155 [Nocardiopsis sp. NPDC006198]|uniref:hypothetical protein n=1 Tax=Nocardiopsis sp. NPDC006198 TaxID=3154472 RepID=UPI0033B1BF10
MPSPLTRVPPLVRAREAGGYAYLLAWVETRAGLRARITWVEQYREEPYQWRWEVAEVPATRVTQMAGQSYQGVPRERRVSD